MEPTRAHDENLSHRLDGALTGAWAALAPEPGLFPGLAFDAARARATTGELVVATPRLLELIVTAEATVEEAASFVAELGRHPLGTAERAAVTDVLDAWWQETLLLDPGAHREPFTPAVVLGVLAGFDAPMVRWLGPWLTELDGPGAHHLAAVVVDGLDGPAWVGKEDRAGQVQAWAATEPVVNGLTLIGGVHLGPDAMSDVLDRLI